MQDVPRLGLSVAPPAEGPSTSPRLDRGTSEGEEEDDVLIEFRNVHKAFGPKKILRGASFKVKMLGQLSIFISCTRDSRLQTILHMPQIRRGEAVGIIGGSGTGKSTTLKLATGLLAPDQGEVVIKGRPRQGLLVSEVSQEPRNTLRNKMSQKRPTSRQSPTAASRLLPRRLAGSRYSCRAGSFPTLLSDVHRRRTTRRAPTFSKSASSSRARRCSTP